MRGFTIAALVAVDALINCQPAQVGHVPMQTRVPVQTALLPPPRHSSAPLITSWCDGIEESNQQVFAGALAKWDKAMTDDGGVPLLDTFLPQPCLQSTNSAWTVALESFDTYDYPMFAAKWSLVHVDHNGAAIRFRDDGTVFTAEVGGGSSGPEKFWAFDFEDDGEPEVIFTYDLNPVETGEVTSTIAYRFHDGAITPYVPVKGWNDLRDIDKDGRPDAVVDHQTDDSAGCGYYPSDALRGPTLVAHSVHGGFSTTDAVAIAAAMKSCPERPKKIVVSKGKIIDEDATATNVICARVWGEAAADVDVAITAGCHPPACTTPDDRPKRAGECFHIRTLTEWAEETPIVTLH